MRFWKCVPAYIPFFLLTAPALPHDGNGASPHRSYDVHHYKLVLSFEQAQKKVLGTLYVTLSPLRHVLDSVVLDAVDLNIESVSLVSGTPLSFNNRSPELAIHFDRGYSSRDTVTVSVRYSALPKKGLYFVAPDSSAPLRRHQIWSQGQDIDNRHWFPCYDSPDDKASSEIIATVQENFTLVSNGRLVAMSHDRGKKTRTFHWSQSKPHSSYLIMLAAGEYAVIRDSVRNIPLEYYVYAGEIGNARRVFASTPDILKFFEERFQYPYPWEKYAQVILDDFMYGGMENTSAVTLNQLTILDDRAWHDFSSDDVIAHEVSHQWWGNLVTCKDWSELWLNEGFATYFEWLYRRHKKGSDEFEYERQQSGRSVFLTEEVMGRKPLVSEYSYETNLYQKGAWVVHMLSRLVGEETFWRGLRRFLRQHEFGSVGTRDLRRALEEVSGKDLGWFFDQWVYKAGYPVLRLERKWSEESKELTLVIRQEQVIDSLAGVFALPLEIEFTTLSGRTVKNVWLRNEEEKFVISLDHDPLMIIVDKGQNVLKTLVFEKSKDEFCHQLLHADNVTDRMVAARELRRFEEDPEATNVLIRSALTDPFWGVRREATISLRKMDGEQVLSTFLDVCKDSHASVRGAAILALENYSGDSIATFLESAASMESSYVVLGYALEAMASVDRARAFRMASRYVDMDSYRDIVRRAALNAFRLVDTADALPYALKHIGPRNAVETRLMALNVISGVGGQDSAARLAVLGLLHDRSRDLRIQAIHVLALWGGRDAEGGLLRRRKLECDEEVLRLIESSLAELSTPDKN